MFKKILRMAMTFVVLTAAYHGYSRGFAVLAGFVGTVRNVPILPATASRSKTLQETIDLATTAFGPGHWAVSAPMHYYDVRRGYYIYWRDQVRLNDGKTWEFSPVAIITRSGKSRELKTITGEKARVDFNRPFDVGRPGDEEAHVTHALIRENVRIRADKGTPDIADDFTAGPLASLEFDEAKEQISSMNEERIFLRQADLTVSGIGLVMQLRERPPADPNAPARAAGQGFDGIKSLSLMRDVEIDVQDVGSSGIVPGGSSKPGKVVVTTTKDGKTTTKAEPRPGHIQCSGTMTIDMPEPRRPVRVGPPAPADPTYATFDRNVRVRQGDALHPEQLDADHLLATLYPAEKPVGAKEAAVTGGDATLAAAKRAAPKDATRKDDTKADGEEPAEAGALSNLTLHRAHATGHAVWLQSQAEGMKGFGNELIYDKFLPEKPDKIYFRGDKYTEVEKTDFDAKGKPQTVNTVRSKDFTVFQYAPGGPQPAVVANGPGTLESRAAGAEAIDRFASWQDKLVMQSVPDSVNRVITLYGHPRVRSTQGDITADEWIVAHLEPKPKADDETKSDSLKVVEADGKAIPVEKATASSADEPDEKPGAGMRIKKLTARGNVRLVTVATPADPKANPPRAASPSKEVTARLDLKADFADAPATAATAETKKADAPATPAPAIPLIERPELVAQADPQKPAEAGPKPAAKPAEPPMTAIADHVWALVLQEPGSDKGQVQEARLTGDVEVHQDPAEGKTKGSDLTGRVVYLKNGGENRAWLQAQGTVDEPAVAISEDRTISGPILTLDQAKDHAWVKGAGRLKMEQADSDFLDDTAPEVALVSADGAKLEPKKPKKGPMVITWGESPDDKTAWMHFYGQTVDKNGSPGPAKARFFSHVRANSEDSSVACEDLEAIFDGPIAFVRPKRDPNAAKAKDKEKEPGPQIAFLHCMKNVEIIGRKIDPETGYLKDKKRILHDDVTYDKATGRFHTAKGPGEVFLYSTKAKDKDADAPKGPLANATGGDRRAVKPVTNRVASNAKDKAEPPEISLTHVRFSERMFGRFAPPKDAKPGDYSEAEFRGSVEAVMAKVADENVIIDNDRPPPDFYRLVSKKMMVQIEPPPKTSDPKEKESDRVLLDAWGNANAFTRERAIRGDRITYDSMNQLSYVYGYETKVDVANQDGAGQPSSNVRGRAFVHNHKTGFSELIDPQTFQFIDPKMAPTNRSALVPYAVTPGARGVEGLPAPSARKPRDPNDPLQRMKQLRLPPRSDKERRGFYGR